MPLTFNPAYVLKRDRGAVFILPKENLLVDSKDVDNDSGFFIKVHSIQAAILAFFDGRPERDAVADAASFLNISTEYITNFIQKITENKERVGMVHKTVLVIFPKRCLIFTERIRTQNYDPGTFDFGEPQLKLSRHLTPTDITFMVTTRCATDCLYCYADRRNLIDSKIPFARYQALIDEARELEVRAIDVIGGEFFLYKQWREMLRSLKAVGYFPYISTKVPLEEKEIADLAEIGIKGLQVSLDSLVPDHLAGLLSVKPKYAGKIKETFRLLDKYGIKTFVHTIMTSRNDSVEDMRSVYEFLKTLGNIDYWRLDKASLSLYKNYKTNFPELRSRNENTDRIMDYFRQVRYTDAPYFDIRDDSLTTEVPETDPVKIAEIKSKIFSDRSLCTANVSGMFILPDGQVTICEELYWTPRFIIGNVLRQGLDEIWNSEKALNLHNIRQEDFPTESACRSCQQFEECRRGLGVCYRDTIKAYGEENWMYADRNCPKSVKEFHEIM